MPIKYTNNAAGTLASGITSVQTTLTLNSGQGDLFPALTTGEFFYATVVKSTGEFEIVKVTARAAGSNTLSIERGQEGTTALVFDAASKVEHRITAAALNNFPQLDKANTLTGANTFSGNNTHSGANTFSGNNTFAGTQAFTNATISGTVTNTETPARKFDAFPAGTRLLFQQTNAPVGWTKVTDANFNDRALRIVTGGVGAISTAAGANAFSTIFAGDRTISQTNLPNVTLTVSGTAGSDGAHTHFTTANVSLVTTTDVTASNYVAEVNNNDPVGSSDFTYALRGSTTPASVGLTSSNGAHTHSVTGTTSSLNGNVTQTAFNLAVAYCDVIIAAKD